MSYCHVAKNSFPITYKNVLFFIKNSSALRNVPQCVKHRINPEHTYKNYFIMACYTAAPSSASTLKIITVCSSLYADSEYTYYNDKVYDFRLILENMSIII